MAKSKAQKKKAAKKRHRRDMQEQSKRKLSHAVLEALITEFMDSVTSALYVLAEVSDGSFKSEDGKFNQTRALKGLLAVCMVEGGNLENHMQHHVDTGGPLRPRHKAAQNVLVPWLESVLGSEEGQRLSHIEADADVNHDPGVFILVKTTHQLLRALHTAMHVDSTVDQRNSAVRQFESRVGWG